VGASRLGRCYLKVRTNLNASSSSSWLNFLRWIDALHLANTYPDVP